MGHSQVFYEDGNDSSSVDASASSNRHSKNARTLRYVLCTLAVFFAFVGSAQALTFDQAFNYLWMGTEDVCNSYGAPIYECLHANTQNIYGPFNTGVNKRDETQWWGYGYFTQADVFGVQPSRSCRLQRNYDPWGTVVYEKVNCYSGAQG